MFKESYKYYKSKVPPPDMSDVLDFYNEECAKMHATEITDISPQLLENNKFYGCNNIKSWKIYNIKNHPGLVFIKNPFTDLGQRYWICRCIKDYTKSPNKNNLPAHLPQPMLTNWWKELQRLEKTNKNYQKVKTGMRWATVGYHYDWDKKIYSDSERGQFPYDLYSLTRYILELLGYEKFCPQAAIVNFYPIGTTLAGHTDHSENDLKAPLISLSFGQSAIFLIGGTTKELKPTPILLRSGDILVMSKESRLCCHAVPRVFKVDEKPWELNLPPYFLVEPKIGTVDIVNESTMESIYFEKYWKPYEEYISDSRININVRQVLKAGQKKIKN